MPNTDFKLKYVMDVIKTLNELLARNLPIISLKRVRDFNNISNSDKSRINFYWRVLKMLYQYNFIEKIELSNEKMKRYEVNKEIELDDVLNKAKDFFMPRQTKIQEFKNQKKPQFQSYYDWETSFKKKVFQ